MGLLERLYRGPLGRPMSRLARIASSLLKPRMIYGYEDPATGEFRKYFRMSSSVAVMNPRGLSVGDHVWVWHHTILDATEGISIGEGAQIGAWVGVFTHGSEASVRLLGRSFVHIPNPDRKGYTRGAVHIGAYSFVGAGSVILPGVRVGRGVLVAAMSLVTRDVPDYAIVRGQPAKVVGDTRDFDAKYFADHDFSDTYYDANALDHIQARRGALSRGAP